MKQNKNKYSGVIKLLFFACMLLFASSSYAQRPSVTLDAKLGQIALTDETGAILDANNITATGIIKIRIPLVSDNHGKAIPKGSSKIKIGLGSKLELDPAFDINTAELNGYFSWSKFLNEGQIEITGDLANDLPSSITAVNVFFKVRAITTGSSTITANFLITNHSGSVTLSDENGANNASSLAYTVTDKVQTVFAGDAMDVSVYPNPVADQNFVNIQARSGVFIGQYSMILFDAAGKKIQTSLVQLNSVSKFEYKFGNIASGKYLVQMKRASDAQQITLHFVKF